MAPKLSMPRNIIVSAGHLYEGVFTVCQGADPAPISLRPGLAIRPEGRRAHVKRYYGCRNRIVRFVLTEISFNSLSRMAGSCVVVGIRQFTGMGGTWG